MKTQTLSVAVNREVNAMRGNCSPKNAKKEGIIAAIILSVIPAAIFTLNALHIINLSNA